jgi:hypothetical protein
MTLRDAIAARLCDEGGRFAVIRFYQRRLRVTHRRRRNPFRVVRTGGWYRDVQSYAHYSAYQIYFEAKSRKVRKASYQ